MSAIIILILNVSCKKDALLADKKSESFWENKNDPLGDVIIEVTFKNNPEKASTAYAKLKYNKKAALNLEWDDNSVGTLDALAIFNGNVTSNGKKYSKKSFTDGCGNDIPYRAALAVNAYNVNNNKEIGLNYPDRINYTQMKTLIKSGWDIENHSAKHIKVNSLEEAKADLLSLNNLLYNRISYAINTLVVPSNFDYYMKAAAELGFLGGTIQADNVQDQIPLYPTNAWIESVNLNTIPNNGFIAFNRSFNDDWTDTAPIKEKLNKAFSNSNSEINNLARLGSHNVTDVAGFASFLDFISQISNDKLWVSSLREVLEYRITQQKTIKSEELKENTLIISLKHNNLENMIRWRDMSLIVSANAPIAAVKVTGADSFSYNPKTGLINIFKENKVFFNGHPFIK